MEQPMRRLPRVMAAVSFVLLLALRVPVVVSEILGQYRLPAQVLLLVGSYLCTAVYLMAERERLASLQVTRGFFAVFLLLPFASLLQGWISGSFAFWMLLPPAAGVLIFLLPAQGRPGFQRVPPLKSLIWLVLSLLLGVGIGLLLAAGSAAPIPTVEIFAGTLFLQFATVALTDEPLFRGFLPEFFRRRGWNLWLCCLAQAVLFTLAYAPYGMPHLLLVRLAVGFVLGVIAWKSRSLLYPMLSHALIATLLIGTGRL